MISGHPVTIKTGEIIYLTPDDDIVEEDARPDGYDFFEDLELRRHPRMRRVLTPGIGTHPSIYGFLHWTDDTDLTAMDKLAITGHLTVDDLATGLLVEARSVICRSCEAGLRLAVPVTGYPPVTAQRVQDHDLITDCPLCHESLRGLVAVEDLNQSITPDPSADSGHEGDPSP